MAKTIFLLTLLLSATSAAFATRHSDSHLTPTSHQQQADTITNFYLPSIPDTLRVPEQRLSYLLQHYWDKMPFTDPHLPKHRDLWEQAWANFADLLQRGTRQEALAAVHTLFTNCQQPTETLKLMDKLAYKYLYHPLSPFKFEEAYLPALQIQQNATALSEAEREAAKQLLQLLQKNREGSTAADFTYITPDGREQHLHTTAAHWLLISFTDPDCQDCRRLQERIEKSPVLRQLQDQQQLKVMSLYVQDEIDHWKNQSSHYPSSWIVACNADGNIQRKQLYNLKQIPMLYLLDKEKKVLLKDCSFEQLENFLRQQQ